MSKPEATGLKYDNGKPRFDLLDPLALEGLARVLDFGTRKYAAHNWRGGISYSRIIRALVSHSFALLRGEDTDPESGLPHVDHIGCNWMFLSNMMKTRPDLDDRYKSTVSKSSTNNAGISGSTPDVASTNAVRGGFNKQSLASVDKV